MGQPDAVYVMGYDGKNIALPVCFSSLEKNKQNRRKKYKQVLKIKRRREVKGRREWGKRRIKIYYVLVQSPYNNKCVHYVYLKSANNINF